jgi:hypothetical protein
MDYKTFFNRVQKTYPFVTKHLAPKSHLNDMSQLPDLLDRFIAISGHTRDDVMLNKNDSRILFVAVIIQLSDPLFYNFDERARYRLILSISRLLRCDRGQILYNLRKSKNFWKVYPEFRSQVEDLYRKIICL